MRVRTSVHDVLFPLLFGLPWIEDIRIELLPYVPLDEQISPYH